MFGRKVSTLVAVFALCILFAAPAVHADGPADDGSTTTTTTGGEPTASPEHSPNMDPDGLTAAAPGDGAGTFLDWIGHLFTALFANVV